MTTGDLNLGLHDDNTDGFLMKPKVYCETIFVKGLTHFLISPELDFTNCLESGARQN